jgi:hypothetical protein
MIHLLAGLQSTIQSSPSQVRGGLSEVSDQVRLKPSTTFGALSLGLTFGGIRPFAGSLFTIQPLCQAPVSALGTWYQVR